MQNSQPWFNLYSFSHTEVCQHLLNTSMPIQDSSKNLIPCLKLLLYLSFVRASQTFTIQGEDFLQIYYIFNYVSACVSMCRSVHMDAGGQNRASNPTELDLQEVGSFLTWLLGTKLRSSVKASSAINSEVSFQASRSSSLMLCPQAANIDEIRILPHQFHLAQVSDISRHMSKFALYVCRRRHGQKQHWEEGFISPSSLQFTMK